MAGMKLAAGATVIGFSAVSMTPPEGVLTCVDEPVVVTGGGLPPEGRSRGPGVVSTIKVTPLSEYPRRAARPVESAASGCCPARRSWSWGGPVVGPAWAAAASGDPVELPATYGRRDGSGTPVESPPTAIGRPHR
jgi:DNA gyrase subunit A